MTDTQTVSEIPFEPPAPGPWGLDPVHFPRPVTRYWASMHPAAAGRGVSDFASYYGMLIDTIEFAYVNGFCYTRMRPVSEDQVPGRFQRAEEVVAGKLWRDQVREWDETVKPASVATHREIQAVDPDALSDRCSSPRRRRSSCPIPTWSCRRNCTPAPDQKLRSNRKPIRLTVTISTFPSNPTPTTTPAARLTSAPPRKETRGAATSTSSPPRTAASFSKAKAMTSASKSPKSGDQVLQGGNPGLTGSCSGISLEQPRRCRHLSRRACRRRFERLRSQPGGRGHAEAAGFSTRRGRRIQRIRIRKWKRRPSRRNRSRPGRFRVANSI